MLCMFECRISSSGFVGTSDRSGRRERKEGARRLSLLRPAMSTRSAEPARSSCTTPELVYHLVRTALSSVGLDLLQLCSRPASLTTARSTAAPCSYCATQTTRRRLSNARLHGYNERVRDLTCCDWLFIEDVICAS